MPSIAGCISKFLADVRSRLSAATVKKDEVLLKRERVIGAGRFDPEQHSPTLSEFCASNGMVVMSELTPGGRDRLRWAG